MVSEPNEAVSVWFQASLTNCVHKKVFWSQENWQAFDRSVRFYLLLASSVVGSTCPCDSGTSSELRCPVSVPACVSPRAEEHGGRVSSRGRVFLLQPSDLHLEMALAMTPVSARTSPGVRSVIQTLLMALVWPLPTVAAITASQLQSHPDAPVKLTPPEITESPCSHRTVCLCVSSLCGKSSWRDTDVERWKKAADSRGFTRECFSPDYKSHTCPLSKFWKIQRSVKKGKVTVIILPS